MFRELARFQVVNNQAFGAPSVFRLHPADITALMELMWDGRPSLTQFDLGRPHHRSDLNRFQDTWFGRRSMNAALPVPPAFPPGTPGPLQPDLAPVLLKIATGTVAPNNPDNRVSPILWPHLIYAYMIENTRIYDIFRRVVHEFTHGEKLGAASVDTQHWLRTTEQLFFRDAPPFFVTAVTSDVRPAADATRRNAYQRLFGMDLNHGSPDNKPFTYARAEAANKEFVSTFEDLLREVWVGIINATNFSGTNATDDAKLTDLIKRLHDMLLSRRVNGTLSREEFTFVSMMSWFHLTVEFDSAVVVDLRSQAASAEQRLYKIAQQIGLPAHGLASSYFEIADSISFILLLVESGFFAIVPNAIASLYTPNSPIEAAMRTIITHWSIITGRDVKAGKVAPLDALRRTA